MVRKLLLIFAINGLSTMASEQKQSMPIPAVWKRLTEQKAVSIDIMKKTFLMDSKQLFIDDVKKHAAENGYIPIKQKNVCRIMTFNVRMWTTLQDKANFDLATNVIKKLDPDIVLLQEVVDWDKTYDYFVNTLGYNKITSSCITANPNFGPAIFVKNFVPINSFGTIFKNQSNPDRQLSFVRLDLKINDTPIAVYNTHLEVDQLQTVESMEGIRKKQLAEIFADAKKLPHSNIIIGGDFNSVQESNYDYQVNSMCVWDLFQKIYVHLFKKPLQPSVLNLFAKNKYRSSFKLLQWSEPKFTNWSGRVLDFIFFAPQWKFPVIGSYVYYTDASDHLPLIVDLKV